MNEPKRTSSGSHRLGLADCPRCEGRKVIVVPLGVVAAGVEKPCPFCDGSGKVTLAKAGEYFGLEPVTRRDTPSSIAALRPDTLPPDTEPDPEPKE